MSTRDFYTVAHETLQCIYNSVEVAQVAHARIQAHKATSGANNDAEVELEAVIHGLERLIDHFEFRLDSEIGDTPMAIRLKTTLRGIRDLLENLRPSPELEDLCSSLEQLGVEMKDGKIFFSFPSSFVPCSLVFAVLLRLLGLVLADSFDVCSFYNMGV